MIIMRVLTQLLRQAKRWAYCQICMQQTDQEELAAAKKVWRCEQCNCLVDRYGVPVAH